MVGNRLTTATKDQQPRLSISPEQSRSPPDDGYLGPPTLHLVPAPDEADHQAMEENETRLKVSATRRRRPPDSEATTATAPMAPGRCGEPGSGAIEEGLDIHLH